MSFFDISDIEQRQVLPGCRARFVHADNMTLSYWDLEAGAVLPPHSHSHEQVTTVISGKMEMRVGDETKLLGPGCGVTIPANTEHTVKALDVCFVVDAFYPVREDYR